MAGTISTCPLEKLVELVVQQANLLGKVEDRGLNLSEDQLQLADFLRHSH